jgi:NTP pyrophosphatase (non-canonical NTP hydrolase)
MNNIIEKTRQFNAMFSDLPNEATFDKEAIYSSIRLLNEEIFELKEATNSEDFEEVRDAIADIQYVLCGLINKLGLDNIALSDFLAVHKTNMAKFLDNEYDAKKESEAYTNRGTDTTYLEKNGKYFLIRVEDGKLIKPSTWIKHDFIKIKQ